MSKFLPFITENFPPKTIFKALLVRSKNIDLETVLVVYCAILDQGIEKVRHDLKQYNKETELDEVFRNIYNINKNYKFLSEELSLIQNLVMKIPRNFSADYTDLEYSGLLLSIAKYAPSHYKKLNFSIDVLEAIKYLEDFKVENLKYVSFSEKYEETYFYSFSHFISHVVVAELITKTPTNIYPQYLTDTNEYS